MADLSPDHDERIRDFLARHGGSDARLPRASESVGGMQGWTEVYAHDGYVLRCDWFNAGDRAEMRYAEIAPTDS